MRFAYIDSQGKEVPIPSVEALQLRIELGAITEGTRFYDASMDRWAPAGEHEIFRTLSRDSGDRGEGGFVAPPPPTRGQKRPGAVPPAPERPGAEVAEQPSPEATGGSAEEPTESAEPTESTESTESAEPARPRDPDPFEREMGPSEDEPSLDPFEIPVDGSPLAESAGGEPSGGEPSGGEASADEPSGSEPAAADDFDFEGFGTIELDDAFTAPAKAADESGEEVAGAADVPEDAAHDEDTVQDEGAAQAEEVAVDDLDLEPPLSEQAASSFATEDTEVGDAATPGAPEDASVEGADELPAWMTDDVEDDETASAAGAGAGETPAPAREGRDRGERGGRAPAPPPRRDRGDRGKRPDRNRSRTRPTPPPRRGKESDIGRIVAGVGAVAFLVFGGWYLLTLLGDGGERTVEAVEPAVDIPELPSELVSTFDETAPPVYAAALDSLRGLGSELPEAPPDAWLGGNYLANASRFPGVRDYWGAIRSYVDRIRASGEGLFVSLYEAELDSAGVAPGSDRDALVERARAGFQASRPDREVIYDQLEGLIDAAEGLDDFLRENEASIDYEPAAGGISRDPVVEAVPATEAMGEEMWDRVARITAAMDALGAVDRVQSELLLDILFDKLARTALY